MCHVWLKACWQYDQKWRKDFVLRFQLSTHISAFNLSRPTWMKQNSLDLKFSRAVWTFVQLQPINALSVSATVSAQVFCGTKKTLSLSPADSNWFIKEKGWDFSASPYCVHNLPFGSYRILPILMLLWMLLPVMAFDGLICNICTSQLPKPTWIFQVRQGPWFAIYALGAKMLFCLVPWVYFIQIYFQCQKEKMTDRCFLRSTISWVSISGCLLFCTENWRTILCKNTLYQQSL